MTVEQMQTTLGWKAITLPEPQRQVEGGYVGDLLSWVMGRAGQDCAWLTIMSNQNVAAVALMADVACVVLTEGVEPDADLLRRAGEKQVNLLGTAEDTFTAACRLGALLHG